MEVVRVEFKPRRYREIIRRGREQKKKQAGGRKENDTKISQVISRFSMVQNESKNTPSPPPTPPK